MTTHPLTEPAILREAARRLCEGGSPGICAALARVVDDHWDQSPGMACVALLATYRAARRRVASIVREARPPSARWLFPPFTHKRERVLLALFLACEAEDDS